jgi:hypothetical protein
MSPNCCGGASCACKFVEGNGITITGSGSSQDPFLITASNTVTPVDNSTFDVNLTPVVIPGGGTEYRLEVKYAPTAKLDDIPDVQAPAPTNGQVLGWDNSLQRWTPRPPTTAAAGSVSHDTSLTGDGSVGTPLGVQVNPARGLGVATAGLGLTDTSMRQLVRTFTDASARSAMDPTPVLNELTMLDSNPGNIDYWTGSQWLSIQSNLVGRLLSTEFLQLSGPWNGVSQLTHLMKNVVTATDATGLFEVLAATDLTGRGGVLTVQFTPAGIDPSTATPWMAAVFPSATGDSVNAMAWSGVDGSALASLPVIGVVDAWVY